MAKLIGTGPNQVPTNADLGTMAYQDYDSVAPVLIGGRRNLIINGDFAITQRSDYSSSTAVASGAYSVDRWKANDPFNLQRFTGQVVDGIRTNYVKVSYNGTQTMGFMQLIEDKDYEVLRGQTITISAYVRTNQPLFGFRLYDGSQNYGPRFKADGNWHRATWTLNWSPSSPSYFQIMFDTYTGTFPTIGSGDYMDIAMVQVELGKVATPFEHRSYGEELARCQRYFERRGTDVANWEFISDAGQLTSATNYQCAIRFNEQMRAPPTMSVTGTVSNLKVIRASVVINVTGITASDNANGRTLLLYGTCASSGGAAGEQTRIQTAVPGTWVNFDAEL